VIESVMLLDAKTNGIKAIKSRLNRSRSDHTATLLPDGSVLIFGGLDAQGDILAAPEIFNPVNGSFEALAGGDLLPRARHTAVLLTDGTVLLAGGVSTDGSIQASASIWDTQMKLGRNLSAPMNASRLKPEGRLLADGSVYLSGGAEGAGTEVYLPWAESFERRTLPPMDPSALRMEGSFPEDRSEAVHLDTFINLRFSRQIQPESAHSRTVMLLEDGWQVPANISFSPDRRLMLVQPSAPLEPGSRYDVVTDGLQDDDGHVSPYARLTFTASTISSGPVERSAGKIRAAIAPANSKNIKTFLACLTAELPGLPKNATIADAVELCIPKGVCGTTVTMSGASQQPACTIAGVKLPRIILDCPGAVANKKFRPSWLLCPTAKDGDELRMDKVELGEDNKPVTFGPDRDRDMGTTGDLFMGDIYVDRSKKFAKQNFKDIASHGDRMQKFDCDRTCHKPNEKAAATALQPFPPINPFGGFKGVALAPFVEFTDHNDKKVYPKVEDVPDAKKDKKEFKAICDAITANKKKVVDAGQGVKAADMDTVEKLCVALLGKAK